MNKKIESSIKKLAYSIVDDELNIQEYEYLKNTGTDALDHIVSHAEAVLNYFLLKESKEKKEFFEIL